MITNSANPATTHFGRLLRFRHTSQAVEKHYNSSHKVRSAFIRKLIHVSPRLGRIRTPGGTAKTTLVQMAFRIFPGVLIVKGVAVGSTRRRSCHGYHC